MFGIILALQRFASPFSNYTAADSKHPRNGTPLAAPNDYVDVSSVKDGTMSVSYHVDTSMSLPEETSPAHHSTSHSSSTFSVAKSSVAIHHV